MSTAIEEREILSGMRRAQEENRDLRRYVEELRARLKGAEAKLALRLDARQTRAILDENAELRRMNAILLERNQVLARKQRRQRPTGKL